uniref:DUF834 domain-containing protein n=1 Tax=Oryza nivara TaxID=4536 RepID=A0A0E0HH07_ORYNI
MGARRVIPFLPYITRATPAPPALQRPAPSERQPPPPEQLRFQLLFRAVFCWGDRVRRRDEQQQARRGRSGGDVRGGGGRRAVRGVVVGVRRRVGRRWGRGGPVLGGRRGGGGGVGPDGAPPVRAAAAAAVELGQHLRHVVHDGAAPSQERVVQVLRGEVPVVRVHVGGEVPGGSAQEGEAIQVEDQVVQQLRRAGRDRQDAVVEFLRESEHDGGGRIQGSPDPCKQERLPSVVATL